MPRGAGLLSRALCIGFVAHSLANPVHKARRQGAQLNKPDQYSDKILVELDAQAGSLAIPCSPDIAALSIEFCYLADYLGDVGKPNELSLNLLQNVQDILGSPPHIRIGGHTQDVARYDATAERTLTNVFSPGDDEAVNVTFNSGLFKVMNENVPTKQLFTFGLNYGQNDVAYPLAELSGAEDHLLPHRLYAYELGNEPDFYNVQRPGEWNVETYVAQQSEWLPQLVARIQYPDHGIQIGALAQEPIYMGNFSLVQLAQMKLHLTAGNVKTFSDHNYPFSICDPERASEVSLENLMNHIMTTQHFSQWASEIAVTERSGAAFTIGETGSVSCHGKEGVSNTFGAALWQIDYLLHGAVLGMKRVHFHMGTPFFYSMWQPVPVNGTAARVYPTYYSILFTATAMTDIEDPRIYEIEELGRDTLALYAIFDGTELRRLVGINLGSHEGQGSERMSFTLDVSAMLGQNLRLARLTGLSTVTTDSSEVTWMGQSFAHGTPEGERQEEYSRSGAIEIAASEAVILEAM